MKNRRRSGSRCPARSLRAGFTLIELLFVMMLIAILTGIAAPHIDLVEFRMQGAAQAVGTTLLAAQRLAVKDQHNIVVAVDVSSRALRLHEDGDNDGAMEAGEPVRHVMLEEGVVFGRGAAPARAMGAGPVALDGNQGGLPAITFHRDGSASEEGGFYLTSVRSERTGEHAEDSWAIEIERATGRVNWFRYRAPEWHRGF